MQSVESAADINSQCRAFEQERILMDRIVVFRPIFSTPFGKSVCKNHAHCWVFDKFVFVVSLFPCSWRGCWYRVDRVNLRSASLNELITLLVGTIAWLPLTTSFSTYRTTLSQVMYLLDSVLYVSIVQYLNVIFLDTDWVSWRSPLTQLYLVVRFKGYLRSHGFLIIKLIILNLPHQPSPAYRHVRRGTEFKNSR